MFYIIEYNTDMRYPRPEYHKFNSLTSAQRFEERYKDDFAFKGAATHNIPVTQQNWHHRVLSSIYEMPKGFNLKREAKKLEPKEYIPQGTYPVFYKTRAIYKFGKQITTPRP